MAGDHRLGLLVSGRSSQNVSAAAIAQKAMKLRLSLSTPMSPKPISTAAVALRIPWRSMRPSTRSAAGSERSYFQLPRDARMSLARAPTA